MDDDKHQPDYNGRKHLERIENHIRSIDQRLQGIESDLRDRVLNAERSIKDHDARFAELKAKPLMWWVPAWLGGLSLACLLFTIFLAIVMTDVSNLREYIRTAVSNASDQAIKNAERDAKIEAEVRFNRTVIESLKEPKR